MRLTQSRRVEAKQELLDILSHGEWFRSSELSGTQKFHGEHTLRLPTVRGLLHELRDEGKVAQRQCGQGMYTWHEWAKA